MTKVPRLLDTFTPNHYNLTLDLTRAEEKEFSGTVIILASQLASQFRYIPKA